MAEIKIPAGWEIVPAAQDLPPGGPATRVYSKLEIQEALRGMLGLPEGCTLAAETLSDPTHWQPR